MTLIVGIDLGTTYSLVSVLRDGAPVVLPNALGELLTPSAIAVDEQGLVLVGAAAKARCTIDPENVALAFKRDMGTARTHVLRGRTFTPQELSSIVLASLKRDAEAALGAPIDEAVITVPAYFGDLQRQATRDAAAIAGLRAERIVNEPTAAALAYGLHERHRELRVAVLDLGGGTFDVTVLEIMEGVIEIQSSAGDARLGGEDFDDALASSIVARVRREHGIDLAREPRAAARVRDAAERAKRRLSDAERTRIALPMLPLGGGRAFDLELELGRDEAEAAWAPVLDRVRAPIARALRDAHVTPDEVDEVLLVGGSTRMPAVARLAAQLFGRLPLRKLPPDEAVAMGAAVQAALKAGDEAVDDLVVTDVAPFSMGIAVANRWDGLLVSGAYAPILERGAVVPCSREKRFHTLEDDQVRIRVEVFQGEHALCRDNQRLGELEVANLPRGPAGSQAIDVRFTYDLNGILEVEATVAATGMRHELVIERQPGRLTAKQIAEARAAMARLKFHPRDALPNKTALARADALFVELTGARRERLGEAIGAFRAALDAQEPDAIEAIRSGLLALVDALRRES